jgi:diguanylate cyclase (GGDEF)-like protein
VYFDLDRFKLINDLYGHGAGDKVLKKVSERIKTAIGPKDLLSRVGGDEFVVAFADATVAEATTCCEKIVHLIGAEPYQIGRQRFTLNVSGGLVGTERFGAAPLKEIMSAADTLCRVAKKRATQRLIVMESDDSFFRHHKQELEVIAFLERGVAPEGLFLVMQPEMSLTQPFDSLNFEILLRMRKSDGSIIPAGVIIEAAEMHGKTAIIDRWVMTTAIAWLETHAKSLINTRFVSINLSGGSLNDDAFTEELFVLFAQHPTALSLICIEITESVALTDIRNVQRFIDRVRALGAKVAIDDFGAGYSSFGYLRGLSVDALKLDGSLVKDATHSHAGLAIIEAIGGLVSSLGMKSIGEYAEDLATIRALVDARIDYAQGYGISKPVLPERILAARSSVDFIEDPEILAFVTQLQTGENTNTMPLFADPDMGIIH